MIRVYACKSVTKVDYIVHVSTPAVKGVDLWWSKSKIQIEVRIESDFYVCLK